MEITGTIKHVLQARSGVSSRTGNAWMIQDYVMEYLPSGSQEPKHFLFAIFGEDNINRFALVEGDEVTVTYDVDAHEYNGRWFGDNRANDIKKHGGIGNSDPLETDFDPNNLPY